MGKYDAWRAFFRDLDEGGAVPVDVLEAALGSPLPPVARKEAAFWANTAYASVAWTEYGWYAHPRLREGVVIFDRTPGRRGRPRKNEPTRFRERDKPEPASQKPGIGPRLPEGERLVLIGCVAQKQKQAAPAKDLYVSSLWRKRRRYAESIGQPWGILSAEYGYLDPETVIEPYDRYLAGQPREYRTRWSRRTADQVIQRCRELDLGTVEVHAGAAYLGNGLIAGLNSAGIRVLWPLRGLKIGEQLSWYDRMARQSSVRHQPETIEAESIGPDLSVDQELPQVVSLHLIGEFDFRWPDAVEHFEHGWEGEVEYAGKRTRFRHGVGHRAVYSAERIHTVTWLNGEPTVEGVATDDYPRSRALISLIKPDGRSMARMQNEVPIGYESFTIVDHRSEIEAPYSHRGLAVKICVDDVAAWAHHALLRKSVTGASEIPRRNPSIGHDVDEPAVSIPPIPRDENPVSAETKAAVVERLVGFGDSETAGVLAGEDPQFTPDPEANAFLLEDPFAFLVAVICDYQIKAERAWETPYVLAHRLGYFDPERILTEPERLFDAFEQRPALHRYVRRVPEYILEACRTLLDEYAGDAGQIWSDQPTAEQLQRRLRKFPGISQKKAAMAVEMLERDFKVPIADMGGSDVALDVHVRRVFLRAGLAERDDVQDIVRAARALYPQRPGALDLPAWIIGRTWCRPRNPQCSECALGVVCPKLVERGDAVRGA